MLLGACASKLACVECHDPHAPDGDGDAARARGPRTRCTLHEMPRQLRVAARRSGRTRTTIRRARARAASSCHMPKKNMALDGTTRRATTASARRPIRSASCSTGRSSARSATPTRASSRSSQTMETWWKRPYDREALRKLYGSARRERPPGDGRARQAARAGGRVPAARRGARRRRRSRSSRRSSRIRIRSCVATRSARSTPIDGRARSRSTSMPTTRRSRRRRRRGSRR